MTSQDTERSAARSIRNPPTLVDSKQYEIWKKEVELWQICCKLDKKEQGPALALSLTGKAKEAALELSVTELNADGGVKTLTDKLDGLFLKDENQRICVSLKSFEQYKREVRQSIDSFINDFERLHIIRLNPTLLNCLMLLLHIDYWKVRILNLQKQNQ